MSRLTRARAAFAVFILALFILCPLRAYASDGSYDEPDISERADEAIDDFYDEMPESAREYADMGGGASVVNGFIALLESIAEDLDDYIKQPLRLLGTAAAAAALCAAANALCSQASAAGVVKTCGAAFTAITVSGALSSLIDEAVRAAERSAAFTAAFTPVFAGLVVSSGRAGTGAFYALSVTAAQSVFANLLTAVIKPLTGILLGLSLAACVREGGMASLAESVKKTAVWIIGAASALFCGVVKLQTSVTASADSLALRATRFAVSGALPIIGGAVSEALSTVGGGLSVIRGTVGVAGIAAIAGIFTPVALRALLCSAALSLAAMFCEAVELQPAARALRGLKSGSDILCAVVVFNSLCLIIATAALIGAGGAAL